MKHLSILVNSVLKKVKEYPEVSFALVTFIGCLIYLFISSHNATVTTSGSDSSLDFLIKNQNKKIEAIEKKLDSLDIIIVSKIKEDSILTINIKNEIESTKTSIKKLKYENSKGHIIISNSDIDESYSTLTENIKKRKR